MFLKVLIKRHNSETTISSANQLIQKQPLPLIMIELELKRLLLISVIKKFISNEVAHFKLAVSDQCRFRISSLIKF